ncbi:MAG: hypothetical protein CMJ72_12210 [Planctomycetaceae bacterium]|nr:hypothetical protein [Planctomycetaceae bacterium]
MNSKPMDEQTESAGSTNVARDWCAVLFALALPSLVTLTYFIWAQDSTASIQQSVYSIAKVVQFAFPVVFVVWIQKQRLQFDLNLPRGMMLGGVFGLIVFIAGLTIYRFFLESSDFFLVGQQRIQEKIVSMGLEQTWKFIAMGTFYCLIHSLLEEYYWRWFAFRQLNSLVTLRAAIMISALGFMAHHVIVLGHFFGYFSLATGLFSVAVAIGGVFWAWLYHRSGSLLGPWLSHLLIDAAIFTIGYDIAM